MIANKKIIKSKKIDIIKLTLLIKTSIILLKITYTFRYYIYLTSFYQLKNIEI